jgi:hypothetical protein
LYPFLTWGHEVHQEKSRLQESLSYAWQAPEMALQGRAVKRENWLKKSKI